MKPVKDHPPSQTLVDPYTGVKTINKLETICTHPCFTSKLEPTIVDEAFSDEDWVIAMQEELTSLGKRYAI